MKRIIALALSVLLLCTMAWAEESPSRGLNLTITSQVEFDRSAARALLEKCGLAEHRIEFIDALMSLWSSASEELIIANQGAQYALKLDGEDILTCVGEVGENGILIASSLFPNYLLTFEGLKAAGELSPTLLNALQEYFQRMLVAVTTSISNGETERGVFNIDGEAYDARTPMTVDTQAILSSFKTQTSELLRNVALRGLLQSTNLETQIEALAIESAPDVAATLYQNSAGSLIILEIAEAGQSSPSCTVSMRRDDSSTLIDLRMPERQLEGECYFAQSEGFWYAFVDVRVQGQDYSLAGIVEIDDVITVDLSAFIGDQTTPILSDEITIAPVGQRTLFISGEGKTALSVKDLIDKLHILYSVF